jgi:hypothetical protein
MRTALTDGSGRYRSEAAAATAAFRARAALFRSQLPTLQPLCDASLVAVPDGRRERGGMAAARLRPRPPRSRVGNVRPFLVPARRWSAPIRRTRPLALPDHTMSS